MIYIPIELWPYGDKKRKRTIGSAIIVNDGTGTVETGNYNITIGDDMGYVERYRVEGFERKRPIWDLLYEILRKVKEE